MSAELDQWVLVPREPTEVMLRAASDFNYGHTGRIGLWEGVFEAMLAAAPTPPPVDTGGLVERLRELEVGYRPHVVGKALGEAAAALAAVTRERDEVRAQLANGRRAMDIIHRTATRLEEIEREDETKLEAAEARVRELSEALAAIGIEALAARNSASGISDNYAIAHADAILSIAARALAPN